MEMGLKTWSMIETGSVSVFFFEHGENHARIHEHRPFCKHGASFCQLQALINKRKNIPVKKKKKECPDGMQ
jgi:uncharacterized Rossmann fold enzyme